MEAIAIVTILALGQFFLFSLNVGQMRQKHGVMAPATSGAPEFERMFRVQQNTMEQLIIFLPALWIFGRFVSPLVGAALGLVFVAGRFVYKSSYVNDPARRGPGFLIGMIATMALLLGGLGGAAYDLFVRYFG